MRKTNLFKPKRFGLGRKKGDEMNLFKIAWTGFFGAMLTALMTLTWWLALLYGIFWILQSFGILEVLLT